MRSVTFESEALRTLKRLPSNTARLIVDKIAQYAADPASLANNVKRLKGSGSAFLRLRVGDWRVIMKDDGTVVAIVRIRPRGSAYE